MGDEEMQSALISRYGRNLPLSWYILHDKGCFDPHHANYLQLSDLQWLNPARIVRWSFAEDQIAGLMPFALTAADDLWCIYDALSPEAVVFCPNEDEVAYAYAPDFSAFIFRAVLEEYACTCLTEYHAPGKSLALLGDYAQLVRPALPLHWADILEDVGSRPLQELEHGYFGTLSASEVQVIVSEQFAEWSLFDAEFEHFKGN